jgi:hypothetical protein
MAANWQKILFSGSGIETRRISASDTPTITDNSPALQILTVDNTNGQLRSISQSLLGVQAGDTLFTISGSSGNTIFSASSDTLILTSSDASYLQVSHSFTAGGTSTSSISLNLAQDYVSGSAQLNAINYPYLLGLPVPGAPSDWNTAFGDLFQPGVALPPFNTDGINPGSISFNTLQIGSGSMTTGLRGTLFNHVINEAPYTGSFHNLWRNAFSGTSFAEGGSPLASNPLANAALGFDGKRSVLWISSSIFSGFADGTPSLTASYELFNDATGSNSASIASLSGSIHTFNFI